MTSKASATATEVCVHHWVLPSPGGQTTTGVCKHCGDERQFSDAVAKGWGPRRNQQKK